MASSVARWPWLAVTLLVVVATGDRAGAKMNPTPTPATPQLVGQFLVASPRMTEPGFAEAVIYIVAHNAGGAMGLIVNRVGGHVPLRDLLGALGIRSRDTHSTPVHIGGPVEAARGFVLHSNDYHGASTQRLTSRLSLSVGVDVLQAIAAHRAPRQHIILFGYAGWAPGQLESEIARNDWLVGPVDESLIFSTDTGSVWQRALRHAGMPL